MTVYVLTQQPTRYVHGVFETYTAARYRMCELITADTVETSFPSFECTQFAVKQFSGKIVTYHITEYVLQ